MMAEVLEQSLHAVVTIWVKFEGTQYSSRPPGVYRCGLRGGVRV
jgi:hypothetical protein